VHNALIMERLQASADRFDIMPHLCIGELLLAEVLPVDLLL